MSCGEIGYKMVIRLSRFNLRFEVLRMRKVRVRVHVCTLDAPKMKIKKIAARSAGSVGSGPFARAMHHAIYRPSQPLI